MLANKFNDDDSPARSPDSKNIPLNLAIRSSTTKKEINLSIDKPTRWRLKFFSEGLNNSEYLEYGDIIWLNHAE